MLPLCLARSASKGCLSVWSGLVMLIPLLSPPNLLDEGRKFHSQAAEWGISGFISGEKTSAAGVLRWLPGHMVLFYVLPAMGFDNKTHIYLASGELFGGKHFMKPYKAMFPRLENHIIVGPENLEENT